MKTSLLLSLVIITCLFTAGCEEECDCDNNVPSECGDSMIDPFNFEECDMGVYNSDSPNVLCREDCTLADCGDGILDDGEECDNGENNSFIEEGINIAPDTCRAFPNPDYDLNSSLPAHLCLNAFCGDGITDSDEECDDANDTDDDECSNDCTLPLK